jgi:hypothetical protein
VNGLYNVVPGGNGGVGVQVAITGSSVYYAGGGGGGGTTTGTGGSGGGGTNGVGTANTGGGGGAPNASVSGFAGGSGVVIIDAGVAAASTTGSPTVSGTVYTFTGSGSITF